MRQDVFARMQFISMNVTSWSLALMLVSLISGCQWARPVQFPEAPQSYRSQFASSGQDGSSSASSKDTSKSSGSATTISSDRRSPAPVIPASATSAPQLSDSATIRGQSGGWDDGTAGSDDRYRSPMVATDTRNQYVQPAVQLPATPPTSNGLGYGLNNNSSNNSAGGYYAASPQQPPINTLPPTGGGYGYGYGNQPAAPAVGTGGYGYDQYGYGPPAGSASPSDAFASPAPQYGGGSLYDPGGVYGGVPNGYGSTIAPGVMQGAPGAMQGLGSSEAAIAPGVYGGDPMAGINSPDVMFPDYRPNVRVAPLDIYVQEGRTGRVILGGSVNSDLGVAGQLVIEERNFDISKFPTRWGDVWNGRAFRGGGENFRAEFMPGTLVERYTVSWATPNLLGYLPYSLSVGGFYYTRRFRDWTEQRLGGRVALGYEITKDLSISSELRMEDVKLFDPIVSGVPDLDAALGSNDIYTARFRVAHDTRDSPFMPTEGSLTELIFDQVFGEYDFSRGQVNYSKYFLVGERPDGSGRRTLASTWRVGVTGSQTPIFENFYAGGYSTLRGFSFRGASPVVSNVQVGGEFMFLGSLEYLFPLTADEMLRGVAFVDYGTVEQDIEITGENFRVAPGIGFRVNVPALGPAPLAFDFAYPITHADNDDRQVFSFFMGLTR